MCFSLACVFYTWGEFYMPLFLWFENSKLFLFPWGVILLEIKTFLCKWVIYMQVSLIYSSLCTFFSTFRIKKKIKTNRDKSLSIFSTLSTEISLKTTHIHQLWSSVLDPVHPPSVRIGTSGEIRKDRLIFFEPFALEGCKIKVEYTRSVKTHNPSRQSKSSFSASYWRSIVVHWTFTTKTMLNFVGNIDRIAAAFTSSSSIFAHKVSHLCCVK